MGTNDSAKRRIVKNIYNLENTRTAIKVILDLAGAPNSLIDPIILATFDDIKNKRSLESYLDSLNLKKVIFSPPFYTVKTIASSLQAYLLHDLGAAPDITLEQIIESGELVVQSEEGYVLSIRT